MIKELSELSLQELWQLFPIFLVEHKTEWDEWYSSESAEIISLIPKDIAVRISHIGSTVIPDIWSKNIVDILLEVRTPSDLYIVKDILICHGWLCMSEDTDRISMNKGYTPSGFAEKVFHLHIHLAGDIDELYFRDYLRENPLIAKEYETLKLSLMVKFEHNRDGYTESKSDFIRKYSTKAKKQFANRY